MTTIENETSCIAMRLVSLYFSLIKFVNILKYSYFNMNWSVFNYVILYYKDFTADAICVSFLRYSIFPKLSCCYQIHLTIHPFVLGFYTHNE